MVSGRLQRGPLSERTWSVVNDAVIAAARHVLAARRIATFDGPKGWDYVAAPLGSLTPCQTKEGRAVVCTPNVVPLVEVRAEFRLPWPAVQAFERGGPALDTRAAEEAAREVALAEDRIAFYGEPTGTGFLTSPGSPCVRAGDWTRPGQIVDDVLKALEALDQRGVPGPYEAVLSPGGYYAYLRAAAEGGYPAARQLKPVLAGVHRSEALRGRGAIFATRGQDFVLSVGGDLSVGYRYHDSDAVHLACLETVAAQLNTPEAVCLIVA